MKRYGKEIHANRTLQRLFKLWKLDGISGALEHLVTFPPMDDATKNVVCSAFLRTCKAQIDERTDGAQFMQMGRVSGMKALIHDDM